MTSFAIGSVGCVDCSRSNNLVPASKVCKINGYRFAMCSSCNDVVSESCELSSDVLKWYQRAGQVATVSIKVPSGACVACFVEEKTAISSETFEGVPMCSECNEYWTLQRTYLTTEEWSWGTSAELLFLTAVARDGALSTKDVIIYK